MGYTDQTLKKLFALSGNVCAFPGCNAPIVDTDTGVVVGDICHIKGRSENGPRYDPAQSEAERNGYDNLLVMCVPHNRIVDGKKTSHLYPVEVLQVYKRNHEAQYHRSVIDNAALDTFVDEFMIAGSVITTYAPIVQNFHGPVGAVLTGAQSAATVRQDQSSRPDEEKLSQPDLNRLVALYQERLTEYVNSVRLFGETGTRSLNKVFVELKLTDQYERASLNYGWSEAIAAEVKYRTDIFATGSTYAYDAKERQAINPDKLLLKKTSTVIVGDPGSGKTTLLKYLAWKALSETQGLPVFLELKSLTESLFSKTEENFAELLFEAGVSAFLNLSKAEGEHFKDYFFECLQNHEVIIFIDGLDEVSGSEFFERLCLSINGFLRSTYSNNLIIISTRPYALQTHFEGLRELEIAPLSDRQIRAFLLHYFGNAPITTRLPPRLRNQSELHELARVPFLLGVIAYLYQQPEPFAGSRLELYRQITRQLTAILDREKSVDRFNIEDEEGLLKKDFLKYLSFESLLGERKREGVERVVFTDEDILKAAKSFCRGTAIDPYMLSADVKATPMLREIGADVFTFVHLTLQEYLAATALRGRDDFERVFCRAYFDATVVEMEVLPMFFGLSSNPAALYSLLDHLPESLTFTNLRLQARSLTYVQTDCSERLESLTERLLEFINQERKEETPYTWAVLRGYAAARPPYSDYIISRVASLLGSDHEDVRRRAINALGEFGGERVVDILIGALKDERQGIRSRAAVELGDIGDERAVEALLNTLHDEDVYVRDIAARALGQIGDDRAVEGLIEALGEKEHDWGRHAAAALGKIGGKKVKEGLLRALKDSDGNVRCFAVEALRNLGEDGVPGLILALADESEYNRVRAIEWLARLKVEDAADPLLNSLRDEHDDVRKAATKALAVIGGQSVIQSSIKLLKDTSPNVRQHSAEILGELKDERAIQDLAAALDDSEHEVRVAAVEAIRKVGGEQAVSVLLRALESGYSDVRSHAAEWLGGVNREEVIRPLILAIKDESANVRAKAAWALIRLGGKQAVDFLMDHLDPSDSAYWFLASQIGPAGGEKVLDWLVRALESGDENISASAASSLAHFKEDKAVDALVKALSDESWGVRERAAKSLGKIGSKRATAGLIEVLKDEEFWVSEAAAAALGDIGDEGAIDALIELLNADQRNFTVWDAERALTIIGGVHALTALFTAPLVNPRNEYRRVSELINEYDKGRTSDGLIEILKHGERCMRLNVIKELGEIDDEWAIEALHLASEDADQEIRILASSVLKERLEKSKRDKPAARPKSLRDRKEDVRTQISEFMKVSEGSMLVKDLLYLLRSQNEYVRSDAAKALAGLNEKSIELGLIEALNDEDTFTRQKAAEVLAYYSEDINVREPLSLLADNDSSENVRIVARVSMKKLEFRSRVT